MSAEIQHDYAHKLLRLIQREGVSETLTYRGAAKLLKRPKPQDDGRAFGSICDLLDAAACLAGVPALALFAVKNADGKTNPRAWGQSPDKKAAILERSKDHKFTDDDFAKIHASLERLYPLGNRRARSYLNSVFDREQLDRRLLGDAGKPTLDALNDLDAEPVTRATLSGSTYVRNHALREIVLSRANGVCEFCGRKGFLKKVAGDISNRTILFISRIKGPIVSRT